jgi:hypothetical protein
MADSTEDKVETGPVTDAIDARGEGRSERYSAPTYA